ncbi:hypothetical protein [Streptomyces sulfonofaciens]|nr:hypothetical protein [Streptomyces sulfonofaciens]
MLDGERGGKAVPAGFVTTLSSHDEQLPRDLLDQARDVPEE